MLQQKKKLFRKKRYHLRNVSVIVTSENKLSIAPEIEDVSDQKRVAVFTLTDGKLKSSVMGKRELTVSTNSNSLNLTNYPEISASFFAAKVR